MDDLKPCPFCQQPLAVKQDINPRASCETEGCWLAARKISMPIDDPRQVAAWNARATPTAQAAEIARLKEALNKANLPEWFYHPDCTESVLFSPDEVIDEVYDFKPGWHIAEIDCAKPLPTIWCAVHVRTCDEMDALETDDRLVFTEHASREAAEAALTGSQSHD